MQILFDDLKTPKQHLILDSENPYDPHSEGHLYNDYRSGFVAGANNQPLPREYTRAEFRGFMDGDSWFSNVNLLTTTLGGV